MPPTHDELRQLYADASNVELRDALNEGAGAYTKPAWDIIEAEVARRRLHDTDVRHLADDDLRTSMRSTFRTWDRWFIRAERAPGRVNRWILSLPVFWQPVATGAFLIVEWMLFRIAVGGWIFILLAIATMAIRGDLFWSLWSLSLSDMGLILGYLSVAILGGALSGLSYSIVGRYLRPWGRIGSFLGGIATIMPYAIIVTYLTRLNTPRPLFSPFEPGELYWIAGMSSVVGCVLGYAWWLKRTASVA